MVIWVQFLFKPNSPNIFFTRVSIYIRIGQFFDLSKNHRFWVFQEIPESKNWLFPCIWKPSESNHGWFLVFQNLQRTANFHERIPNSFLVLWLFEFIFWVNSSGWGFHKMGIAGDIPIYLVWKSQFVVRSKQQPVGDPTQLKSNNWILAESEERLAGWTCFQLDLKFKRVWSSAGFKNDQCGPHASFSASSSPSSSNGTRSFIASGLISFRNYGKRLLGTHTWEGRTEIPPNFKKARYTFLIIINNKFQNKTKPVSPPPVLIGPPL